MSSKKKKKKKIERVVVFGSFVCASDLFQIGIPLELLLLLLGFILLFFKNENKRKKLKRRDVKEKC